MLQSFLSTALPIVVAVLFGIWTNNRSLDRAIDGVNRRLDDFGRRLDRIGARLDSIDQKLAEHGERIARLELTHR